MARRVFINYRFLDGHTLVFDKIGKNLVKHVALCAIRCPLSVGILSSFSAMCIADDVAGLSVMHGGRRIVGVVASGQVEAVEHHLELVLISARFYRFPRLLDTPIGYFLYFRSNPLNYSEPLLLLKWLIPRVPIKWS